MFGGRSRHNKFGFARDNHRKQLATLATLQEVGLLSPESPSQPGFGDSGLRGANPDWPAYPSAPASYTGVAHPAKSNVTPISSPHTLPLPPSLTVAGYFRANLCRILACWFDVTVLLPSEPLPVPFLCPCCAVASCLLAKPMVDGLGFFSCPRELSYPRRHSACLLLLLLRPSQSLTPRRLTQSDSRSCVPPRHQQIRRSLGASALRPFDLPPPSVPRGHERARRSIASRRPP